MKPLEAWEELLRQAIAKDFDEQQHALFQIGLILERHSRPNTDAAGLYDENLTRELLRLTLDDERQAAAVLYLATLVRNKPEHTKSFLYAISRAKPEHIITPLLALLRERGKTFAPDAAYQAVVALEACIKAGGAAMMAALRADDPSDLLDEWAESPQTMLADKADWVLEKIEKLLDEGDKE
jgi:hypothetical protein